MRQIRSRSRRSDAGDQATESSRFGGNAGLQVTLDARMAFHSGIGRYIQNLTRNLVNADPTLNLTLLIPPGSDEHPWKGLNVRRVPFGAPIYGLREQVHGTVLGQARARLGDLTHFPHYNAPWGLPRRSVVTIHDLTHVDFPHYFGATKVRLANVALRRAVQRAGAIIAVSDATRDALLRRFPICESKTHVIPLGVDECFRELPRERVEAFRAKHGLRRFVLFVGSGRGHKNLAGLLGAHARLDPRGPWGSETPVELVVVGDGTVEQQGLPSSVRLVSQVTDDDLALWYNAADLLCMPSINEGFGLPALEAMACGTPVVASDIGVLRELVGDAGLFASPQSAEELTAAIERVLSDAGLSLTLRRCGLERAKRYRWDVTAMQTLALYRAVAGARG